MLAMAVECAHAQAHVGAERMGERALKPYKTKLHGRPHIQALACM
jgi:hypothetical protein